MKYLALCLAVIAARVPLSAATAQTAAATDPSTPAGSVSWSRGDTREREDLLNQYQLATRERNRLSGANKPEDLDMASNRLETLQRQLETLENTRPWKVDVTFPGGSLAQFLALLSSTDRAQDARPEVNVIGADGPADLQASLPPFTLKNADSKTIFSVLHFLLEKQGMQFSPAGDLDSGLGIVGVLSRSGDRHDDEPDFAALQLGPYIANDRDVEPIAEAIRTAWTLQPGRDMAVLRIQYHAPTKMLLVSGPSPAAAIAREVLAGLSKGVAARAEIALIIPVDAAASALNAVPRTAGMEPSAPTPLRALTSGLAVGDDAAWLQFHRDYGPGIFHQLLVATRGNHDLAAEALQQTYLRIARNARACDEAPMFAAWLRTVARSALYDCLRRRRSFSDLLRRRAIEPPTESDAGGDGHAMSVALDRAIAQLSPVDRALLERKYFAGIDVRALAVELCLSEKAVESRLVRARAALRELILVALKSNAT